jgi:hypothetical protein
MWGEAALGFKSSMVLFGISVIGDPNSVFFFFVYPFHGGYVKELAKLILILS